MRTCTWAPTVFQSNQVVSTRIADGDVPAGEDLHNFLKQRVEAIEAMGFSDLLIAQRWWGSGIDIEGSSLDCLAMTALFAGWTNSINLVTAIHPGFFQPTAIAKWGTTLDRLTAGRWSINVTSGWNMEEFEMYGIDPLDHDQRYARSKEFIQLLRLCWEQDHVNYRGTYYRADKLKLEPRPTHPLEVFQGGQSPAAIDMAVDLSDWMFLNGGSLSKISGLIDNVRRKLDGREVKFALYAAPLCRTSDDQAWQEIDARLAAVDDTLLAKRRSRLHSGAEGMWEDDAEILSALDSNEGYSARLIGSPDTILRRIEEFRAAGVDMLHLDASDALFNQEVLPVLPGL